MRRMNLINFWYVGPDRNSYINEIGFRHLYVRKGPMYIDDKLVPNVLQLASLEAAHPGKGAFTKLVEKIEKELDAQAIFVENVFVGYFAEKLERLGFVRIDINVSGYPYCYLKLLR
jgi:hypothetical protein